MSILFRHFVDDPYFGKQDLFWLINADSCSLIIFSSNVILWFQSHDCISALRELIVESFYLITLYELNHIRNLSPSISLWYLALPCLCWKNKNPPGMIPSLNPAWRIISRLPFPLGTTIPPLPSSCSQHLPTVWLAFNHVSSKDINLWLVSLRCFIVSKNECHFATKSGCSFSTFCAIWFQIK